MEGNSEDGSGLQLRGYQLEMLEKSMQRNIVVAMDTGSGKTFIAVSRIKAELEKCAVHKIIWFLVPTVALAAQQHQVISEHIPAFQTRLLTGADGVDRWSTQSIWNEVLENIRIVVSTHQVLLDALIHGFIKINILALLVLDEAHHCQASHPYNRIMQDFYHPCLIEGVDQAPAILGLTASPVFNNKAGNLEHLERNLNATGTTPKLHREEMLQFVHQPRLVRLLYPRELSESPDCQSLQELRQIYLGTNIMEDPYVVQLKNDPSTKDSSELNKVLLKKKTYCQDLIKGFYNKAVNVNLELGSWATSYYINACIQKFMSSADDKYIDFNELNAAEQAYLRKLFANVEIPSTASQDLQNSIHISSKVRTLIEYLIEVDVVGFTGLIFVQTRASVAVLALILSLHPSTRDLFSVSTFVGASSKVSGKFSIGELLDVKNQKDTLDDFRSGRKNLVIATSALEEGIDVSACNHVVCFEKPPNLKSFIQRRGRARKSESEFAIMFEEISDPAAMRIWQDLEEEMRKTYMNDARQLKQIEMLEEGEEGNREYLVPSTGAKLTLKDAVQHLYHFCATLPATRYADLRPIFQFRETGEGSSKSITAKVTLPNTVNASVREAYSISQWKTERYAKRDAAFEAYLALYDDKLINEHLLPLQDDQEAIEALAAVKKRSSVVEVSAQLNFWSDFVAHEWQTQPPLHEASIEIWEEEVRKARMTMILPQPLPTNMSFELYWDDKKTLRSSIRPGCSEPYSQERVNSCAQITQLLLRSIYASRMNVDKCDYSCMFIPVGVEDLHSWQEANIGTIPALALVESSLDKSQVGIVRDLTRYRMPCIFQSVVSSQFIQFEDGLGHGSLPPEDDADGAPWLKVTKLPKRADFLHKISPHNRVVATETGFKYLSASQCEVDRLPIHYAQFAMLIPSIMYLVEIHILAEHLCSNLLSSVRISDLKLLVTATSASAAQEATNYQRLEFLGDSILKSSTSLNLTAEHLNWHEGILSSKKDHIVSNASLCSSALKVGLDKYIRTIPFTGQKWRPPYNISSKDKTRPSRMMSTKILADVVEALIGASYIDGGHVKALACLAIFIPELSWASLSQQHQILYDVYDYSIQYPPHFAQLEHLIGHVFNLKPLLVEALTHPSHRGPGTCASYQRLEFLGDSILDNIVVCAAYNHEPQLPTPTLHLIRTTLVNAPFLAFFCLTLSISVSRSKPICDHNQNFSTVQTTTNLHIWEFMRHGAAAIRKAQQACLARYKSIRDTTLDALHHGQDYPWTLLAGLDAPKFFSDIIESLLGAIYIDTHGSTAACETFLETLGVMSYLRRAINGDINLLHPKEELGLLANQTVKYVRDRATEADPDAERPPNLICTVWIGEREVVTVKDGISVVEVETRAAQETIRILKSEGWRRGGKIADGGDVEGDGDGEEVLEEREPSDVESDSFD